MTVYAPFPCVQVVAASPARHLALRAQLGGLFPPVDQEYEKTRPEKKAVG